MKKQFVGLILVLLLTVPFSAYAGPPLDTVKGHIDKVLDVLRDSSLKGDSGKSAKKAKIRSITEKMFDYTELSRRTLGQNWKKFNNEQQKEFIELYKSILEDAYADKLITYTDEKVLFNKENMLSEKTCEIQTTIVTK
jgi:phospholipid transport system substrate-binding protein